MTATTDLQLTNNASGYIVLLRGVHNLKDRQIQPPISIPLVNTAPQHTFHFRFIGQSREITFDFALFDDGTNVTGGTSTIAAQTTVAQQMDYLRRIIFTHEFDTAWTLKDVNGKLEYPANTTINCVISNLEFGLNQGSNAVVIGTMSITEGRLQ